VLVSPWIPAGAVFHPSKPVGHSSVIRTICARLGYLKRWASSNMNARLKLLVHSSCQLRLKIPQSSGRKFPSPGEVVVDSSGYPVHHDKRLVKRRRAMQECNSPRNSRTQTHQGDEAEERGWNQLRPWHKDNHRVDRSAYA
jgi:hypothetical protein